MGMSEKKEISDRTRDADKAGCYMDINNLSVSYYSKSGEMPALCGVSLSLLCGEILAVVGESGSGKSTLARAVGMVLPHNAVITSGNIVINGNDITSLTETKKAALRGTETALVLQQPMSALDPTYKIGRQLGEVISLHNKGLSRNELRERALELLESVGIKQPELYYDAYPGQLSGGMCQRCVIAMALSSDPGLLIADEPTTALDVTIQAEILRLLVDIRKRNNMSIMLITHDLGVAAQISDRITVMKDGRIVETGTKDDIFNNPKGEYTRELIESLPYSRLNRC